jgi:hypothetical protein
MNEDQMLCPELGENRRITLAACQETICPYRRKCRSWNQLQLKRLKEKAQE